jgi:O-antigen ligase
MMGAPSVREYGDDRGRALLFAAAILGGACVVGAAIPLYVGAVGDGIAKIMALPAGIALLAFLLLDRRALLVLILVFRSAGDVLFEATRFSLGSYQIGVGGVVNAFVIMIVALMVIEKPQVLPRKAVVAWAVFLALAVAGVAASPFKADALKACLALLSYFAIFCSAFYLVRSPADFRFGVRVVLWSSAIPALFALYQLAAGAGYGGGPRLYGTFPHPNVFAFYLVLVVSLVLYMLKSGDKPPAPGVRAGLSLYMGLLLLLLLLTQTRSAWIACFAIFAIYGLFFERRFLAYIVVAPLLALLIPGVQDRVLDLTAGNDYVQYAKLNSFAWRRLIWESGLSWMQPDRYFAGYGLESFRNFSLVFFPLVNPNGLGSGAHNVYVQLLFELGAIGLAAYLWLFAGLFRRIRPMLSADRLGAFVSLAAVVAYLIISASDNMLGYLSFNWYFWLVVGSACAAGCSVAQQPALAGNAPRHAGGAP